MGKYNQDTKIGELLRDDRAVAVIEKYLPGFRSNPILPMAKLYSVKAAANYAAMMGVSKEDSDRLIQDIMNLE